MSKLTIRKAILKQIPSQQISVPINSHFIHVHAQRNEVCVWYMCDPSAEQESRTLYIVGTGHEAPDYSEAVHLGTAILAEGDLVLHVFEDVGPRE